MSFSGFFPLLICLFVGLVLAVVVRLAMLSRQEQRAWGDGRSALSRADRREIRRSVRDGRRVADRRLAMPAVRFGVAVGSSIAGTPPWLRKPPRWSVIFGRIFFPVMGMLALVSGIVDRDGTELVSGVVLLFFTILYLPVMLRWTSARRAESERRLQGSIQANRLLAG